MTDSPFPFADAPEAEQAEAGSKRVLVLAGGLVAALVAAAGGFLLLGGGDDLEEEAFVPAQRAPQAAQAAAATQKVATSPKLPVPFEEDLGRDPFRALYVEPAPAPAGVADPADPTLPQGTTAGTADGGTTAGPDAGTGTGVPAGGTTEQAPEAPTAREYALVLKRVYGSGADQTAEFTIDGRKMVAKIGVRFGPTDEIRLISLQEGPQDGQWTAVLQVGDGEPFDAPTGTTVSVR